MPSEKSPPHTGHAHRTVALFGAAKLAIVRRVQSLCIYVGLRVLAPVPYHRPIIIIFIIIVFLFGCECVCVCAREFYYYRLEHSRTSQMFRWCSFINAVAKTPKFEFFAYFRKIRLPADSQMRCARKIPCDTCTFNAKNSIQRLASNCVRIRDVVTTKKKKNKPKPTKWNGTHFDFDSKYVCRT